MVTRFFIFASIGGLALLVAPVAMAQRSEGPADREFRPAWRPYRPEEGRSRDERKEADRDPPRSSARAAAKVAQQPPTIVAPQAAPGAVYLDDYNRPLGAPHAPCLDPSCSSCQNPYASGGVHSGGTFWPSRASGFWVRPEFLYWWTESLDTPPLVTAGGTGVIGQAGTTVLFGGELNDDWRPGGRLSGGLWLSPWQTIGLEGNYFLLQEEETLFTTSGTTAAPVARPFFSLALPGETARLVPGAGFTTGTISARASTELQGGEALLRRMHGQPSQTPTALLIGYRYLRLDDDLRIDEFQSNGAGNTIVLFDSFTTENVFHGVDVGVISELRRNRLSAEFVIKVALGITQSEVQIQGATTTTTPPAAAVTTTGGLLAQSSNIGTYEQDDFAVIPELGATLGYNVTDRLKLTAGYTFIYWSRVARAGDQIDRDLNLPAVPGPNTLRPQFTFVMTDFWAQGVNLGLEYVF